MKVTLEKKYERNSFFKQRCIRDILRRYWGETLETKFYILSIKIQVKKILFQVVMTYTIFQNGEYSPIFCECTTLSETILLTKLTKHT